MVDKLHSLRLPSIKKYFLITGLLLLPVLATGTVLALASKNSHNRGVIMYVGDSNIMLGAGQIVSTTTWNGHNDNGYTPMFVPRIGAGIRTPDCLDTTIECTTTDFWATKLGETFPKVNANAVVTNLGINDTNAAGTETSTGYYKYAKKIDWFMGQIPVGTQVYWTTLPCLIVSPARLTGCQTINLALSGAGSRWPNLTVLNWHMSANTHPEYISSDGIHYNTLGHSAWANFVVKALDARYPVPEN